MVALPLFLMAEFHNFLELREDLIKRYDIEFISDTDTEVLLYGLIYDGLDLFKCNGMWAFCLWDRLEGKATLLSHRFGIKPLFYSSLYGSCLVVFFRDEGTFPTS